LGHVRFFIDNSHVGVLWAFSNQIYKNVHASAHVMPITRAITMGWNPRANPAHHGFGSGWVEIFLQISI